MSSDEHGTHHSELVFAHALRALPPGEVPAVEANLSVCADCRQELEALRPIIASFVSWPTDVLRPAASLWGRLAQRIAAETGGEPVPAAPKRWTEPAWNELAPGISCKLLATDPVTDRVSMLVRLAPGGAYPSHRHAEVEELHLLHGELWIEDRKLLPGDYHRADPGSADNRVWSDTGCTCVLITSGRDALR